MDGKASKATRNDVARLAHVSTAVVSYVFNNGPRRVSPRTEAKVREAADKLNYKPNPIARALRTGNSKTLGAVINDLTNPFNAGVYEELELKASEQGYSTLFATTHGRPDKERTVIQQLIDRNVEALFVSPCEKVDMLPKTSGDCRFIVFDVDRELPDSWTISADYRKAMVLGVEHLLGHGHVNICLIIGQSYNGISDGRVEGWYEAHRNHGLPVGHIEGTSFSRTGGYLATLRILDSPNRPTAIFAGSDLIAMGALRALHERGIKVPEEMALISFDGTIDSQYMYPQLTVLEQNPKALAHLALKAATDPDAKPGLQLMESKLVIRQSCGCK
ncbi:LacI family transcriptional regulator [Bifidobacterium aemilianum]|uniref:LacI family transcriptional regulator n=1 Tax=Bifidobacterium aemilianum TaxID=2493120 RepID=A0A366K7Q5_9BIFI|nr:LacI family DNA-binding transcriptional regulator [Bifidobacterium aemilianum]RBP97775.1 LacI family transcriptional regulator [Bifidobacterium aemilianum]